MAKKLGYNATDADTLEASDFVGAHLYAGDTKITKTTVGAKEAADVYIANPIAVEIDGIYEVTNNPDPDNMGLIGHVRGAAPADADQTIRTTAGSPSSDNVVSANVFGLDVNSFQYLYDGTTWDRWLSTGGAAHIHDGGGSITVDTTSDPALANTAIDNDAITIPDTATKVVASDLANRKYLFLYNKGTTEVYIGKQSGLAVANGFPIFPGVYFEARMGAAIALYGISKTLLSNDIRHMQVS